MKFFSKKRDLIASKMTAPEMHFYVFVAFFVIVFFTGGGSRDDIQSLALLRPLAVLFGAYALTVKAPEQWKGRAFPIVVAGALLALMALQLVPLPPSVWVELPERRIFADIANIAKIEQPWRPLSLSPSKTLNSLFSLSVPIAAMMLYLNLDREYRRRTVQVVMILCLISALLAIFQIIGPERGPLYFYRITNFGTGVGLFANRNHQAVILASTIVMLGWYIGTIRPNFKQAALKFYGSIAIILVIVPLILLTGSRAGLLLMAPALFLALFFVYFGEYHAGKSTKKQTIGRLKNGLLSGRQVTLAIITTAITGIVVSSILLSRSLAFDRLFHGNDVEELRLQLLPTLFSMIEKYAPWGSGFGSFEHVYKIYEPQELLRPTYLNQAHNDWLQFLIEGGIPALLIAGCAVFWFVSRLWLVIKGWRSANQTKYRALMCIAVMFFLLAASIGDYPLRVPSVAALFAVLICVFNDAVNSVHRQDIKPH